MRAQAREEGELGHSRDAGALVYLYRGTDGVLQHKRRIRRTAQAAKLERGDTAREREGQRPSLLSTPQSAVV